MKKRRPHTKNSFSQKYSYTHEHFPIRAKSIYDSKERNSKQSCPKLQQNNNKYYGNTSCLKEDAFGSLESLFDIKKSLNLRDVYPLALNICREKLSKVSNTTKSEPVIETLFLQSFLQQKNIPHIFKPYKEYKKTEKENVKNQIKANKKFQTKVSKSVRKLKQNSLINNQQNNSVNMAENEIVDSEIPEEKTEEKIEEKIEEQSEQITEEQIEKEKESVTIIDDEAPTTTTDLEEAKTNPENKNPKNNDENENNEDKDKVEGDKIDQDEIKEDKTDKDEDKDKVEGDKIDKDEIKGDKTEKDKVEGDNPDKDKDEDEINERIEDNQTTTISPPVLTDDILTEVKEMTERCVKLADEIQTLKLEVFELSNKSELTEEDTLIIQEKQEILMSKIAELDQLTEKVNKAREKVEKQIEDTNGEIEKIIEQKEEEIEEEKEERKDIEPLKQIPEEDRFELPQIEYPEDKLPRVIVCGYAEDCMLPKLVIADGERKGREKCFEKLSGKLTESLTMQEKLVKENAQLEGGKYKLEEALLEKDTALECLQRKVCALQAEMRIIVKENTELNRQLATLNQLVIRPTCCYTCPGVASSPPLTPSSLPLRPHVSTQPQNDVYGRYKCCPQFVDTLSPTTETACNSSRLTGGGSENRCFVDNPLQNVEMCSRSPAVVRPPLPRGLCPAELEDKLTTYSTSTKQLEQQLGSMETEVRNMQMELANVQRERQQLEQQRKLLKCTGPCAPCCCPPPTSTCVTPTSGLPLKGPAVPSAQIPATATDSCTNATLGASVQQQLRDLREQYARLQDDYKSKLCEVSCMRAEAEKFKQDVRDAKEDKERMEIKLIDVQERLKLLETEKGKFEGYKEQLIEQEQALIVAKQRFREAQDELEELRSLIQDQAAQLEDYRNKYLQAQQQVEEQRRQLDLMEMDNARMNENVTLEIGRVKNQFQEKLAELAPLPDILKQMQIKMQEAQQMRLVAERNCEELSRELLGCKDKIQTLQNQLDVLRTEHQALQDEKESEAIKFEEMEKKCSESRHENERMKNTLARFEEQEAQLQKRIDEKMHENTQLSSMLEQIREDSARQVARTKERCETMRRSMQGQIAEMERQLAQCRATARAAQRDRDEIRQKMQSQINNLNEAFKHAQGRIKSLQGHVNYLKTSYSNIFLGQGETPTGALPGEDSCDCNY